MASTGYAEFKAPLPEFKNEKQLAEWRAEKASEATSQGYAAEETPFYTGKPYLASSGGYAFKYRSYNPELLRWTSEDPSGFPDGANQSRYAPNPTSELDFMGLATWKLKIINQNLTNSDTGIVNTGFGGAYPQTVDASSKLVATPGSGPGGITSYSIKATGTGQLGTNPLGTVNADFSITVDEDGVIYANATGANWMSPNGDLQIASTWAKTQNSNGAHTLLLSYTVSDIYKGSGISGGGLAGGTVSWTTGQGQQDAMTSITFKAYE